ncbi:hypothetical protein DXG03_007346 [Asterophora parasitica]|uniref:TPX2 C-terminal domain-containing protein n=1 Tax=Asterophora parasitica TaxID=117018 RepID=A0A9P7G8R0_9AGAR|nr:hypothetical protein DXG03_007346 [Asterophora parasitica]
MPLSQYDSGAELSLRHLPDTSDASFSFQIPSALSKGDLLLGGDDMSFFRDANDSIQTPGPSRIAAGPLTLGELAPRAIRASQIPPQDPVLDLPPPKPRSKSKRTPQGLSKTVKIRTARAIGNSRPARGALMQSTQGPGADTSAATRLDTLCTEVLMLDNDPHVSSTANPPNIHVKPPHDVVSNPVVPARERRASRPKHTIISGGISKLRSKTTASASTLPRNIPSVPNSQQQSLSQPRLCVTSDSADFIQDEPNPDESICSSTTGGVAERLVMYSQKLLSSFGPFMSEPIAPAPEINPALPPGDDEAIPATVNVNDIERERDNPLTLSQVSPSKRVSPLPPPPAIAMPHSPMRPSTKRPVSVAASSDSQRAAKKGKSTASKAADTQAAAVLPPVNPTKPVEFKFSVDARIEARMKAEHEKVGQDTRSLASSKARKTYHVPDFKTLHAQHDAEVAQRKENIVPVVPLPLELNTDGRAREREKFDEQVREKERELERAMEERRREREENEEREIRELRKKAIPKAHEVPEWYKEAPKKKKRNLNE